MVLWSWCDLVLVYIVVYIKILHTRPEIYYYITDDLE